jgi:hypothetical protein
MKRADRISSLIILGICVYFFIEAGRFSPLSGLFPKIVLIILAAMSLMLFIATFLHRKNESVFDSASFRHVPSLISLLLMVCWGILIPVVGFLVTSLVFFPLITIYLDRTADGRKKLGRIALVEGITLAFFLFFTQVLYVPFPRGFLL